MKYNVIRNIRINNIKTFIPVSIFALLCDIIFIWAFIDGNLSETWFILLLMGCCGGFMTYLSIETLKIIINPYKSDIFKKYGNVEKLEKIIEEIENTIEYEDFKIIVAKNYVADKDDFEKILAYKDILRVHKLVHKTNFVIDRYDLVITDKYGLQITYSYDVKEESKVDKLIMLIGSKCDNAKLGYTKEAESHIKKHKEELPKKEVLESSEKYACPECNKLIEKNEQYCKNCGCKIDWEINEEKTYSTCRLCKKALPLNEYGICEECNDKISKRLDEKKAKGEIIECKVCGKEIYYNEHGTCEECHQKILKRLEEKNNIEKKEYCTNCGKEINVEWKFCKHCGNEIK